MGVCRYQGNQYRAKFKISLYEGGYIATNSITGGEYRICKPTDLTEWEVKITILI